RGGGEEMLGKAGMKSPSHVRGDRVVYRPSDEVVDESQLGTGGDDQARGDHRVDGFVVVGPRSDVAQSGQFGDAYRTAGHGEGVDEIARSARQLRQPVSHCGAKLGRNAAGTGFGAS